MILKCRVVAIGFLLDSATSVPEALKDHSPFQEKSRFPISLLVRINGNTWEQAAHSKKEKKARITSCSDAEAGIIYKVNNCNLNIQNISFNWRIRNKKQLS